MTDENKNELDYVVLVDILSELKNDKLVQKI